MKNYLTIIALFAATPLVYGQSFQSAADEVSKDLKAVQEELTAQRDSISKEKIPLARRVNELEKDVIARHQDVKRLLKVVDSRTIDLSSLEKQVNSLKNQDDYIATIMTQFVREFEGRLDLSETPQYEALTSAAKLAPGNVNLSEAEKRSAQLAVIKAAIGRLSNKLGGHQFEGEALSAEGEVKQGKFIAVGPSVYFASQDGSTLGITERDLNAAVPAVVALPEKVSGDLASTISAGKGLLALDSSLGKAIKIEQTKKSIGEYIEDGGIVGYVIIGLGLFALLITLFKMIEISGFKVGSMKDVKSILDSLGSDKGGEAINKAASIGGLAGEMFKTGIEFSNEKRGMLEELLFERLLEARPKLEQFLPFLAITAAAAPLLGLLGTVIGMIKTFQLITIFGTGDAGNLASGISEALITTALGLIVAIPVLILHGMLSRMAKRKLGMLEQGAVAFINGVIQIRSQGGPGKKSDSQPAAIA